jgi:hypothetical protein
MIARCIAEKPTLPQSRRLGRRYSPESQAFPASAGRDYLVYCLESYAEGIWLLITCCAVAGGLLLALYTGGAPTSDIRARVPILLGDRQVPFMFCVLLVVGLLALAFTRGWSLHAIYGVAFGALINLAIFLSGILPRIIPQIRDGWARWSVFVAVLLVSGTALLHERRVNRDAPPSP